MILYFIYYICDHRDQHVLSHSFPTRRASGLVEDEQVEQRVIPHRAQISELYRDVVAGRGQRMQDPVIAVRQHQLQRFGEVQALLACRIDLVVRRAGCPPDDQGCALYRAEPRRSEEHTSELQSLMRISYAVFCLKKKKNKQQ